MEIRAVKVNKQRSSVVGGSVVPFEADSRFRDTCVPFYGIAMGKKKFIDKNMAITFRLVNRNQQDPLFVNVTALQHVLVPVSIPGRSEDLRAPSRASTSQGKVDPEKRKKEQVKFGVYFDDDYDYLQHLWEPGRNEVYWEPVQLAKTAGAENVSIKLPSLVFASEVEEGLIKKKAQQ